MTEESLEEQAQRFAADVGATIASSLPSAPAVVADVADTGRVVVKPEGDVPLLVKGEHLASLGVRLRCELDTERKWLAVAKSEFVVTARIDRTPMIRFEYVRKPMWVPSSHIQIHAHRGAWTHVLTRADHANAHELSALHFPVGGARFRPCLEDVIQFLIDDCGFDALATAAATLRSGREQWRRTQARAVTRDFPLEAAETLRALGYTVQEPGGGHPRSPEKALHTW